MKLPHAGATVTRGTESKDPTFAKPFAFYFMYLAIAHPPPTQANASIFAIEVFITFIKVIISPAHPAHILVAFPGLSMESDNCRKTFSTLEDKLKYKVGNVKQTLHMSRALTPFLRTNGSLCVI